MGPSAFAVTLGHALLVLFGTTASKSPTSSSSSSYPTTSSFPSNGYDACVCGQSGYSTKSGLSYSSDAWNAAGSGFQCLSVINGSSSTSAGFDATWHWPVDPDTVHSFPHVTFSSDDLPISLNDISSLRLAAKWSITSGNDPAERVGIDESVGSVKAKCNVAFDIFLDLNPDNASSALNADYEIMVWIGRVGGPYPLGYNSKNATCYTQKLGSHNFTLYSGQNSRGTIVYTWVSPSNQTAFDEDISPLLQYLWRNNLVSSDARLGLVEFGSEAYHSASNVTFSAGDFSMGIWKGEPPAFDLNPIGESCKQPTSPAGPLNTGSPKKGSGVNTVGGLSGLTLTTATILHTVMTWRHNGDICTWLAAVVLWRICLC